MILLNACSSKKINLEDSEPLFFFSLVPNPPKDFEMHKFDDVIVDKHTAVFLRDFSFEWLRSEDKSQVLGLKVDADKDVCREFLKSRIIDTKVLLNDEECAL